MKKQWVYIGKVVLGLVLLLGMMGAAIGLPALALTGTFLHFALGGLIVSVLLVAFVLQQLYRSMDELQQLQHQQACTRTALQLFVLMAVLGMLQANAWIPMFNQAWMVAAMVALWGVNLMFADRAYH